MKRITDPSIQNFEKILTHMVLLKFDGSFPIALCHLDRK